MSWDFTNFILGISYLNLLWANYKKAIQKELKPLLRDRAESDENYQIYLLNKRIKKACNAIERKPLIWINEEG